MRCPFAVYGKQRRYRFCGNQLRFPEKPKSSASSPFLSPKPGAEPGLPMSLADGFYAKPISCLWE